MGMEIKLGSGDILLFPTPVVKWTVPGFEPVNVGLRRLVLDLRTREGGIKRSNVGGWHSDDRLLEINDPGIAQLRRWIGEGAKRMIRMISPRDGVTRTGNLKVIAWANVSADGHYNKMHNHPGCAFSGVYYVDVGQRAPDLPESGRIEFMDPRLGADMVAVPNNPFGGKYGIEPENGMMLLFPAWLYHGVNPYQGQGERISIAFNINIDSLTAQPAAPEA